jgi:hypothetical protein
MRQWADLFDGMHVGMTIPLVLAHATRVGVYYLLSSPSEAAMVGVSLHCLVAQAVMQPWV